MSLLYITADQIGTPTGGGLVTQQELTALQEFAVKQTSVRRDPCLSSVVTFSRYNLGSNLPEPWKWDEKMRLEFNYPGFAPFLPGAVKPRLAHFYSGTFGKSVEWLKANNCRVTYTVAAHDKEVSRKEHEKLGWPFPYPHLIEEPIWQRYIEGYRLADVIVCPSTVTERTIRTYGPDFEKKDIRVIPHGCFVPKDEEIKSLPNHFTVGYLGSYGADKGVRYLLEAWKTLDYKDDSVLVLAGRDSLTVGKYLLEKYGGGNAHLAGWQKNVGDFYSSITCYIQPSATEGFGCEVLEAASYARPVICSEAAGAVDFIRDSQTRTGAVVPACDANFLAATIDEAKKMEVGWLNEMGKSAREEAKKHSWDIVRQKYKNLWSEVV